MKYVFQFLPSVSAEGRQKISSLARWTSATLRSTITSTKLFSKSETTERPSTSSANTKADNEHQCKFLPIYGNICTVISHETKWRSQFRTHLSTTILFWICIKVSGKPQSDFRSVESTQLQLQAMGTENAEDQQCFCYIKHSNLSWHLAWILATLRQSADNNQIKHRKALF